MAVLNKNAKGYGYKYTDLAEINKYIEELGETYYQYTETTETGNDYIITVRQKDGKDLPPMRGVKIISAPLANKANVAQEYGSGLTYARRYSLLMAYGLATEDDDAASYTRTKPQSKPAKQEKKEMSFEEKQKALNGLFADMNDANKKSFMIMLKSDFDYNSLDEIEEINIMAIGQKAREIVMSQ